MRDPHPSAPPLAALQVKAAAVDAGTASYHLVGNRDIEHLVGLCISHMLACLPVCLLACLPAIISTCVSK